MTQALQAILALREGKSLSAVLIASIRNSYFAGIKSWYFADGSRLWRSDNERECIHAAPRA